MRNGARPSSVALSLAALSLAISSHATPSVTIPSPSTPSLAIPSPTTPSGVKPFQVTFFPAVDTVGVPIASGASTHGTVQVTDPRVRVVLDLPVTSDTAPDTARGSRIEPHLAVNPRDPEHLVGAVVELDGPISIATVVSRDGGRTWSRTRVPACWLDPWVAFADDGRVTLACIDHEDPAGILLHTSLDGGGSWEEPTRVPFFDDDPDIDRVGGYDHEAIAFGTRDGAPALYLVAMQGLRAGGLSRAGPVFLGASAGRGRVAADPDPAWTHRRLLHGNVWANVLNPVSLGDGSVGFAYIDYAVAEGEAVEPLRTLRAWWVRSDDGGRDFGVPRLIAELDGPSTLPVIAADASPGGGAGVGGGAGRVYLAVDERREERAGVRVHRSEDAGDSWEAGPWLTRDTDDGPFGNPMVAVDGRGAVGVAWYDGSDSDPGCHELRFAASVDGGVHFGTPAPVRGGSCLEVTTGTGRRPRWPWGGDYFGLAGLPDGGFQLLWSHAESGRYELRTARIEVSDPPDSPDTPARPAAPRGLDPD